MNVRLEQSPAIMLQGMVGSCFGVWVAHGEGRFVFRDEQTQKAILDQGLVALTYADDDGTSTTVYVFVPDRKQIRVISLCNCLSVC